MELETRRNKCEFRKNDFPLFAQQRIPIFLIGVVSSAYDDRYYASLKAGHTGWRGKGSRQPSDDGPIGTRKDPPAIGLKETQQCSRLQLANSDVDFRTLGLSPRKSDVHIL